MPFPFALLTSSPVSSLQPSDLRCEYCTNPIGLDTPHPRLSWIDVSKKRGAVQSAYRIVVSGPISASGERRILWDSGKVASSESAQIAYGGSPLSPGSGATWQVTVWDGEGSQSAPSKVASWEWGLPKASDWHAKWISLPQPDPDPLKIPSPYFRKQFQTTRPIQYARAYVSAKGLYRFFIDGRPVGKAKIAPDWTDYRKRIQYQSYDVTALLKGGTHVAGLVLGNGWYCGHVGLTGGDNYGTNPEGLVQLVIHYKDGSVDEVDSGADWKGRTGAILSNDLLMGETDDARRAIPDWNRVGALSDGWRDVLAHDLGNEVMTAQVNPPVQVIEERKARALLPTQGPHAYLFDLGQNMVGWAKLKITGSAGETVTLRYAEILNPDGTIYTTNLRGALATDRFTLAGKGRETFEPNFTTHGFRYVEVTGATKPLTLASLTGVVVGSDNPQTGQFSCSNPLVNQLFHNIYWGERGNYLAVPTDCPQRDERLGWMGDAQIFARTACSNNDVAAFLTKWTQDVEDAQSPEGGFSDVSPRMGDQSDGAPAWGDAGVIVPFTVYRCYGDVQILVDRYRSMHAWIDSIDQANPDHLWIKRSNNNFGDWLNVDDDTPRDVLATAYFAYSTELVAKAAHLVGLEQDAARYEKLHSEIVEAFNVNYVDPQGVIKGDTQTAYVLALRFDLLPEGSRKAAADRLVHHIMVDRKGHLSTGFVGVGYLNPTLTRYGHTDVAYHLLTNDTYPSWGYSIRQGATTIWERWDGYTREKGFQDPGMNSFNHYSLGSVGEWMYGTVGGIDLDPDVPGFRKIRIHPIPGPGVTWARCSVRSMQGPIETSWKVTGKTFSLDVTVPANTLATIYIPASSPEMVSESGRPATESFHRGQSSERGFATFEVGGGVYHFTSTMPG